MSGQEPIVVGIDFSAGATHAVSWASSLARQMAVPLVAVHVTARARWEWRPEHLAWMSDVGLDPETSIVRRGVAWIELTRFAQAIDARFLVVGSHGGSGYQPMVPGSTTVLLLTRSDRPVFVVPDASPHATALHPAASDSPTWRTPPQTLRTRGETFHNER
jgi:nucleotide-binding universal stress UspA family protein